MKPKTRVILEECIERGIDYGYARAHKHTDTPTAEHIKKTIEDCICLEIAEHFVFDEDEI